MPKAGSRLDDPADGNRFPLGRGGAGRDEGFAGRNGDAHVWVLAPVGHEIADAQRGADRSLWIVLVRRGGAEHRQDRLTDEFLNRPAELLQCRAHAGMVR